jgi:hypothetical protein
MAMPGVQELRVTELESTMQQYPPVRGRTLWRVAGIATLWAVVGLTARLLASGFSGGSIPAARDIVVIAVGLSLALSAVLAIVVRRTRAHDMSVARNAGIVLGIGLAVTKAPELSAVAIIGAAVEVALAVAANLAAWKVVNRSEAATERPGVEIR